MGKKDGERKLTELKTIARNSLANMFCTAMDLVFSMITSAYVARTLLADGVGRVAYAQSLIVYFLTFAEFGISGYGIREIAGARITKDNTEKIFTELFMVNTIMTTGSLAAYYVVMPCFAQIWEDRSLFIVCGISIFFNYCNVEWFYLCKEEYVYIAVRNLILKILSLTAVYIFVRTRNDYVEYALIAGVSGGLTGIVNMCRLRKFIRPVFCGLSPCRHIKPLIVFMISNLLTNGYSKIDITMLGMLSTRTATGYYTYTYSPVRMIMVITTSVSQVLYPRLSHCYRKERDQFYRLLDSGIRVVTFIVFPVSMGTFILAPKLIEIFLGNDFLPAVRTLRLLSVLIVIQGFADLCFQVILATGNEKKRIYALGISIIGNIALNSFFIPLWADCGAAVASVLSELGINSYLILSMKKSVRFEIPWEAVGQAIVGTGLMGIVVYRIIKLDLPAVILCGIAVLCGAAVYGILNLFMKNKLVELLFHGIAAQLRR